MAQSAGVLASGLQYVLTCVVKHKCRALVSSVCVERLGSRVEGEAFKSSVVGVSSVQVKRSGQAFRSSVLDQRLGQAFCTSV